MVSSDEIKVLGAPPNPFANRIQVALNLKSLKYELILEKFGSPSELLLKSNPVYKEIPVFIHNDKPICGSLSIVQYIDEVWASGPSILPTDPYDRAVASFWATYLDNKWFPSLKEIRTTDGKTKATAIETAKEGLVFMEETISKVNNGKDYFGGGNIGYLDIVFGCYLGWMNVAEEIGEVNLLDKNEMPCLAKWAEKFCSHEAVNGVLPKVGMLVGIAKMYNPKPNA